MKLVIDEQTKLIIQQEQPVIKDGKNGFIRGINSRGVQIAFGLDGKTELVTTRIADMHRLTIPANIQAILDVLLPLLELRIQRCERREKSKLAVWR